MAKRIGKLLLWGLILGAILVVLLNQWIWLAMRINIALAIPVTASLVVFTGLWRKIDLRLGFYLTAEILLAIVIVVKYQELGAFAVIPAVMFREAFFLSFFSLPQLNIILLLLLVAGNVLSLWPRSRS